MSFNYKKIDPEFLVKQFNDQAENMIASYDRIKRDRITNTTDEGETLERVVLKFFEQYLPHKYHVDRGYIMNDEGKVSFQQDIVIYDPNNYVLLQNTDGYKIFPIESVYATVEVKSQLSSNKINECNQNIGSIKHLSGVMFKVSAQGETKGDILDVTQYGSQVFSTVFAYDSKISLEALAKNFRNKSSFIDYVFILKKGIVCYIEDETKALNENLFIIKTTSIPQKENNKIVIIKNKTSGINGGTLLLFFDQILSHIIEYGHLKGNYSIMNYLKIPKSSISVEILKD